MSKATLSIQSYAFLVGDTKRKTREGSLPFHVAYKGADDFQRKDLRDRWMLGHVMGSLAIDEIKADRILSKSRTERTKAQQDAYKQASADFSYHVIRPEPKAVKPVKPVKPVTSQRISAAHRKAAEAYLALFEDAESALAVLQAVAK